MTKIKFLLLLSFALGFSSMYAQKTEILNYSLSDFDKAQLLYNDKQYLASQILFEKIKQKIIPKKFRQIVAITLHFALSS